MAQNDGYQAAIDKLYRLYLQQGFLHTEEALNLMTADGASLIDVNRITGRLLELGVVFTEENPTDDDNDRAIIDYEAIFQEVLDISPGQSILIQQIRSTQPPQNREWKKLLPQMKSGNEYAFNRLFNMYLRVAIKIALQISKEGYIELDDAIQEGAMGLIRGIRQFDPSSHGNLGSYIPLWIQQYISRAAADKERIIRLPVHVYETVQNITQTNERLYEYFGRDPSDEELSQETGVSIKTIRILKEALQDVLSLDSLCEDDEEFDIVDTKTLTPDEVAINNDLRLQLNSVLKTLSPREAVVIRQRYGFDDIEEKTLDEVGQTFGVTRERIRQIETKALRKLLHPTRSSKLFDFLSD